MSDTNTDVHITVLSGASRGLGLAMARQLLLPGQHLLCLARRPAGELSPMAQAQGCVLEQWAVDLAEPTMAAERLHDWLLRQRAQLHAAGKTVASVTLINNAAWLPPALPLSLVAHADVQQALRVGLEAPMLLTASLLHATRSWSNDGPHDGASPLSTAPVVRKVLNISSGLGRRPMASQATYCALKAGLDHYTRCLALEEALQPHGAKVCSLAPGVVDTDMQVQLRSSATSTFPDQPRFAQLHTQGQLTTPDEAARQVLAYLARTDFGDQPVADVRG
ncbi:SDR family NAD(P)-dependent oxidoreductase [Curvibacter sp. CHRR-16]|uniref:SDR family NAD(P)-dependent oxidoreductase n=1 Tax=Curvibacter sp. CHRR-16 TaxID=2835872 RepID=UPI001BD92C5E|nr:SDR family NAD(P)-dependent oxidoreductase [Curvibacter sp. CHRR-16]